MPKFGYSVLHKQNPACGGRHPNPQKYFRIQLLQLLTLNPNRIIGQTSHPKTPRQRPLNRLEIILCARVNQTKQAFHNSRRSAMTLKVDQRFTVAGAGDLGGLLGVVGQVADVERCGRA